VCHDYSCNLNAVFICAACGEMLQQEQQLEVELSLPESLGDRHKPCGCAINSKTCRHQLVCMFICL